MAAQHLVDIGHRNIAVISGLTDVNDRAEGRREGALDILASYGVMPIPEWILQTPYDLDIAKSFVSNLLQYDFKSLGSITYFRYRKWVSCNTRMDSHSIKYPWASVSFNLSKVYFYSRYLHF